MAHIHLAQHISMGKKKCPTKREQYKLEFGPGVDEHFAAFQGVQKVMHRYLDVNTSSDALKWYVGDVDIYDEGRPPVLAF